MSKVTLKVNIIAWQYQAITWLYVDTILHNINIYKGTIIAGFTLEPRRPRLKKIVELYDYLLFLSSFRSLSERFVANSTRFWSRSATISSRLSKRHFDVIITCLYITSVARHPHLYTCKMLFMWHQSFIIKSFGQTSWHTQSHKQTHRVKSLSPRYRGW